MPALTLKPHKQSSSNSSSSSSAAAAVLPSKLLHHAQSSNNTPFELSLVIESPPLMFYGAPDNSSGAILSGLLSLKINVAEIQMTSVTLKLVQEIRTRRPVMGACKECTSRITELASWDLLSHPTLMTKAQHGYPFSHLLEGSLPASTASSVGVISYSLIATAKPAASNMQPLKLTRNINLARSTLNREEKISIRVFPPTNLTANVKIPTVVFPQSMFTIEMRLDGINAEKKTRWKMRKVSWSIEELAKIISPACRQHAFKVGGFGKGVLVEENRTISAGEFRDGWKTDYSEDGKVEFQAELNTPSTTNIACNVEHAGSGFLVTHTLIIELVVVEETPGVGPNGSALLTGSARVLRMQFTLNVSSRPGLGIAWDDEVPPVYEDVPVSPPGYEVIEGKSTEIPPPPMVHLK